MNSQFSDRRGRISVLRAFHMCFVFLSRAYLDPPHQEFIQRLVDEDLFSTWPLSSSSQSTLSGLKHLQKFCARWNPHQLETLKLDYTRLFIGLGKTLAPPYESVYLGKEHTMFDVRTLKVREFYRRFDIRFNPVNTIPDDHMGIELRFCASLFHEYADALESKKKKTPDHITCRQGIEQFLAHHLLQWIDPFVSDVVRNADTLYFRGVASLTLGTVADCAELLGVKPA